MEDININGDNESRLKSIDINNGDKIIDDNKSSEYDYFHLD